MNLVYELLKTNRFTKEYLRRIQFKMSILYPNSKKRIEHETKALLYKRFVISTLIIFALLVFDFSFYWIIVAAFAVISINSIIEATLYAKLNIKILKQFEDFINDIVFKYRYHGVIEEALSDAVLEAEYEIGIHGNFIYELITRGDYEDSLEYYKAVAPNDYFLLFYSMVYMLKQNGDKFIQGKSLFISNMNSLISDINAEVNKQEKINYMFSGLFAITLIPLFAMKPIEIWSTSNIPELYEYYQSRAGMMITVCLSLISLSIFSIMKKMKYPSIVRTKSKFIETISTIPYIKAWQDYRINNNYSKYSKMNLYLKHVCSQYNVKEFEIKKIIYGIFVFLLILLIMLSIGWQIIICLPLAILGGFTAFFIPHLSLKISYLLLKQNIMCEINRFQATIIMCMYQDGVDVTSILHHLEMVAVFFRNIIAKAIDEYSGNGLESLEKLKYDEKQKSFIRIIDGFIACDSIAIPEAFSFIEKDREYDMRKREIQESRQLSNKVALGKFISFIPMMAIICMKLILPFILEGIKRLNTYSDGFTNLF